MKIMVTHTKNILLLVLMLLATGGAIALRPTHKVAESAHPVELSTMIPKQFASWIEEAQGGTVVIDPSQAEMINKIYAQTLSRTYKNASGYRIMLSVAYGNDQSDSMKVHKPEVCYAAQGFQIEEQYMDTLPIQPADTLPIKRVITRQGNRFEPVTYWVTVGDHAVRPDITQKLFQIGYGLSGEIPDGMLIRVSSIDQDKNTAFTLQDEFIRELLASVTPASRQRLAGTAK